MIKIYENVSAWAITVSDFIARCHRSYYFVSDIGDLVRNLQAEFESIHIG